MYCESLNYETALLEPDVLSQIIKSEATRSYGKTVTTFEYKKVKEKVKKLVGNFEEKISPVKKTTTDIVLKAEKAKVEATNIEDSEKNI